MAIQPQLKVIVSDAVARAEPLPYPYPKHFDDIEAAKAYVESICKKKDFKYSNVLTLSFQQKEYIKDKVHFIVAAKAFEQGEFYLKKAMEDRNALRASIEADIHRILNIIKPSDWPRIFLDAQLAKHFVSRACAAKNFAYTDFPGVEKAKYMGFVDFNTARHAFEAGFFLTKERPPKGWVCKPRFVAKGAERGIQKRLPVTRVVAGAGGIFRAVGGAAPMAKAVGIAPAMLKPGGGITTMVQAGGHPAAAGSYATLRDVITADVARLTPLIPTWPLYFTSLNDARDHVANISHNNYFSYTYWPTVEPCRFRLFVNFNTAKRALHNGAFSLVEEVGVKAAREEWAAVVKKSDDALKSGNQEKDEGEFEDEQEGHVATPAAAVEEPVNLIDFDDSDRDSDAASISPFDDLTGRFRDVEMDPFKVLLPVAHEAFTLKSASG
ncbi:hypothetical protein PtrCC142_007617 [Pyrenophora tritici-repentis]|nr:hypothetical protein PtrSN001A_007622 [Pyrenophora tritici-repentis]KAI1533672.1 hypothetical protein PtrSN001C_007506 [Pyrenophora tritici-repentis]KAI1599203.1 hypothetical protein PtrCC142_007617 [Pyrenophora tritici-repentis]